MKLRFRVDSRLGPLLVERGLSLAAVTARARLPARFFEQDKINATTEELFALWRAIGETSDDPAIGLLIGSEQRVERLTSLSIAMLYARSFADALDNAARFKRLTCPEDIEIATRRGECTLSFQWLRAEGEQVPHTLIDVCFAWLLAIGRQGTGTALSPLRVELERTASRARLYERHFGCPIVFGAKRDAIVFRTTDVERPFLTHNADLLAILAPHLEAELTRQRGEQDLLEEVKRVVKRLLTGRRPDLEDVGRELGVASRTLQRRIAERGRTYQQLLEEARRELSHRYLLDTSLELNETAFLLGYTDPNSFFRAVRQWEGTSPGEWRKRRSDRRSRHARAT
jgi:AraC-like DNA-binding protein